MKLLVSAALTALLAAVTAYAYSQTTGAGQVGRYQIVAEHLTATGSYGAVWRLDTVNGNLWK